MLRAKYQCELNKLKVEEKYMRSIAHHIEDQINRLKVEEMALKSQIQEITSSIEKEPLPERSDDVDINSVPLNLGISYMHCPDDDEEEDGDDDDTAEVKQLSDQLDQQT